MIFLIVRVPYLAVRILILCSHLSGVAFRLVLVLDSFYVAIVLVRRLEYLRTVYKSFMKSGQLSANINKSGCFSDYHDKGKSSGSMSLDCIFFGSIVAKEQVISLFIVAVVWFWLFLRLSYLDLWWGCGLCDGLPVRTYHSFNMVTELYCPYDSCGLLVSAIIVLPA